MHLRSPASLCRNGARILLALAFLALPSKSMAEDQLKLSPEQATSLGIRVVHPVASPTDKTLPLSCPDCDSCAAIVGRQRSRSRHGDQSFSGAGRPRTAGQPLAIMESPSFVSQQRDYLHAVAQEVLAAQQLNRNTQLFQGNAVAQRVLEGSQAEARQASIAVAERRQVLRLSGLSDETISKLTSEAAISATLKVAAPRPATVIDIAVSPGQRVEQSAPLIKVAQLSPLWVEIAVPASNIKAIRQGANVQAKVTVRARSELVSRQVATSYLPNVDRRLTLPALAEASSFEAEAKSVAGAWSHADQAVVPSSY